MNNEQRLSCWWRWRAGTNLIGVVADQVRLEFSDNVDAVADEATLALKKFRDHLARMDAIAAVFGESGQTEFRHFDDYVSRSRAVANRWMTAARLALQTTPEITARAFQRVIQVRTPARQGKDSIKDCVVIEAYLDTIAALRQSGLTSTVVFVSSNTKDYAGETGRALNADLAAEFTKIGMQYAPNLAAAKYSLGL
jgi:hypothetical protein